MLVYATSAGAAAQTTAPGQTYVVPLTLTNTAIIIPKDRYSKGYAYPRYPRGGSVRYDVTNKGSRPYSFKIWIFTTPVIPPGHEVPVLLNWNFRGIFHYETLYDGKPLGPKGYVTVF
jgi:hypothetical protein